MHITPRKPPVTLPKAAVVTVLARRARRVDEDANRGLKTRASPGKKLVRRAPAAVLPGEGAKPRPGKTPSLVHRVIAALGWGASRVDQRGALEARVADRLLEREALRGDKTDDQFQLMLDSALKRLSVLVRLAPSPGDVRTEDRLVQTLAVELRLPYAEWKLRTLLAQHATARLVSEVRLPAGGAACEPRRLAEAVERLNRAAFSLKQLGRGEARAAMEVATREAVRWFRAAAGPRA